MVLCGHVQQKLLPLSPALCNLLGRLTLVCYTEQQNIIGARRLALAGVMRDV